MTAELPETAGRKASSIYHTTTSLAVTIVRESDDAGKEAFSDAGELVTHRERTRATKPGSTSIVPVYATYGSIVVVAWFNAATLASAVS